MNINDFRKNIFLNSQYCTYYIDKNSTVLAGIMRSLGYKFEVKFPPEKISEIDKVYRKFTTIMNCVVATEILLYVYLFIFPYFLKLISMPYFVLVLLLSLIPLLMLYLTYIVVNAMYENYLERYVGTFRKIKFQPNIYNIEPSAFEKYLLTPKKSIYVVGAMLFIFLYYVLTPILIDKLVLSGKYRVALKTADFYSKIIPISADVYAQKAYAKFKLEKYQGAVKDYELANSYSGSNIFDVDILGVKMAYAPFSEIINELDSKIANSTNNAEKQILLQEKANYLMKNKKYNQALDIYNQLIALHRKGEQVAFSVNEAYFYRAEAKRMLGDSSADMDSAITKRMCPDCTYNLDTKLVSVP